MGDGLREDVGAGGEMPIHCFRLEVSRAAKRRLYVVAKMPNSYAMVIYSREKMADDFTQVVRG